MKITNNNETARLAEELDGLINRINDLSAKYPMSATQRDTHGRAVILLMTLHSLITGRPYGDANETIVD